MSAAHTPSDRAERLERLRREHYDAEGSGPVNENPDGCYYCGSPHHHSGDCQEREELS
jgi:hypothetical protein